MAKRLPNWINREEFEKMLKVAKSERDKYWKPRKKHYTSRGKTINQYIAAMIFGFGSGMRISEIVGLKKEQKYTYQKKDDPEPVTRIIKSNIPALKPENIESSFIKIRGKGNKERTTYLPTKLFVKANIKRRDLLRMLPLDIRRRAIQKYVSKLGRRVLKKRVTFHMLRHGFASELAGVGKPLNEIRMLTGHSSLDTLQIYLHANPQQTIKGLDEVFG